MTFAAFLWLNLFPSGALSEEIELYRDRKWRREESLKVETAEDVEAMVEDLGMCLGLTDERKRMPRSISRSAVDAMPTCRGTCKRTSRQAVRGC